MNKKILWSILVILFCAVPLPVHAQEGLPSFETTECPFQNPHGVDVQCGFLTVPENSSLPEGPTIRLAVAILYSSSSNPEPDPLVFLQGGPGMGALGLIPAGGITRFSAFLNRRDVILFDQRGTGLSQPTLDCPGQDTYAGQFIAEDFTFDEILPQAVKLAEECRQSLIQQGVQLDAYHNAASAADVEDLRRALGYDKINLYGVSYGTRLALTVLRDYPEGIRSTILDSTFPPQVNPYLESSKNVYLAFETLFNGCEASLVCRLAYPNLRQVFYDTVDQLNRAPVIIKNKDPKTNQEQTLVITGYVLMGVVFNQLYSTGALPRLPAMIYDAHDGAYDMLADLVWKPLKVSSSFNMGMALSVLCSEEASFYATDHEENAGSNQDVPPLPASLFEYTKRSLNGGELGLAVCRAWEVKGALPIEEEPVSSKVPTLILAGQYDPVTPPAYGRLAAETLPGSYFFEFPAVGHSVLSGGPCPLGIMLDFINDPLTAPEASCVKDMQAPHFLLRARLARPWVLAVCVMLIGLFAGTAMRSKPRQVLSRFPLAWGFSARLLSRYMILLPPIILIWIYWLNISGARIENLDPLLLDRAVETVIPLFIAMQAASLFSPEEESALEINMACPRPLFLTLLERLAVLFLIQGGIAMAASLGILLIEGGSPGTVLLRWIPPALFLAGVSVCVTLITRRSAFGIALSLLLWWSLSFLGPTMIQRWPVLWALDVYLQPGELSSIEYLLNRIFLALVGIGLILIAIRQFSDEERLLLGRSK